MTKIKEFILSHYIAIILAILVGVISMAPQLFFVYSLGDQYQGLPLMATDDEDIYLSRMQEIVDGHPLLGSVWFSEYKDQPFVYPPTSDLFLVLLSKIFFISLTQTLLLVKFLFPAFLFLLVYQLILKLIDASSVDAKLTAIAGGFFVTLGYDLIDIRGVINLLSGNVEFLTALVWTRPSNPIHGALIIFSFLLILVSIEKNPSKLKILSGALLFGVGVASYFFTWSILLSVSVFIIFFYLLSKNFNAAKNLVLILILGLLAATPYFYFSFQASKNPFYDYVISKTGLSYSHALIFNKVLLVSFLVFAIFSLILKYFYKMRVEKESWWLLSLSFLLGGIWAFSQQIITGLTIWPPHFVQYTIPLSIIAVIVISYKSIKLISLWLWRIVTFCIIGVSLSFGIYSQAVAYQTNFDTFQSLQYVIPAFNWLNDNTKKDSVVYVAEEDELLTRFVPALTHNNVYYGTYTFFLIPEDRLVQTYLSHLRFFNVDPDNVDLYIEENPHEFYSIFGTLTDVKGITLSDELLGFKERVVGEYPEFYTKDFYSELKKYRLDYILSQGDISDNLNDILPQLQLEAEFNGYYIYSLP